MTDPNFKVGRNEACSCGSGKKFKRCCGAVDAGGEDGASRFFSVAAALTGLMMVAGVLVFAKAFFFDEVAGKKVWSPEHGHYHTVGGSDDAHAAGPGKVWNEAHGHYHNAATAPPPLAGETPVTGALEGLRAAQLDSVRENAAPTGARE